MSSNQQESLVETKKIDFVPCKYGLGYEYYHAMKRNAHKLAQLLPDSNESETYGQVLEKSIRTALKLVSLGIKRGDVICLNTYNHRNACIPYIAAQFLKCTITALDPQLSVDETVHLLNLVKPKMIFLSENAIKLVEDALNQTNMDTSLVVFGETEKYTPFSAFLAPNENETTFQPVQEGNNEDIAMIFFSSGTTGLPKGVCISHRTILTQTVISRNYAQFHNNFQMTNYTFKRSELNNDTFIIFSPFYWITATIFLNWSIFLGASRIISKQFHSDKYWQLVEKYKATVSLLTPVMANDINNVHDGQKYDTSSLKVVYIAGSSLPERLVRDLSKKMPHTIVTLGYGCTEMAGFIATFHPDSKNTREMLKNKPLSCGMFNNGITAKIINPDTEKIVNLGSQGEIRLKCDHIMSGYLHLDNSTVFDSDGYLKTGDLGYLDEDKCLYIVGRIKEIMKYKGYHVSPELIEKVLLKHEAVKETVVIGIPHQTHGDHPMGLVVLHEHFNVMSEDLVEFVNDRVSDHLQIRAGIKIVTNIPKTLTGKFKRTAIRDMIINGEI